MDELEQIKMKQTQRSAKSIFEYTDYRRFLSDTYLFGKAKNRSFSFRYFSRITGFQSSNYLMLVMKGLRNLSVDGAEKIAKGLKLNREETVFFVNLVQLNQSKTAEDRQTYAERLMRSKAFKKLHPLKETQYNYYAQWYYILVRELVGLPDFKEDFGWISKHTIPSLTAAEAGRAIEELLKLGLLKRDSQGRLRQSEAKLATADEVTAAPVANYHREMMKKAAESIDTIDRSKREISSVTFLASKESVNKVKEMIQVFRKEVTQVLSEGKRPDTIYQLNFQLFPLADVGEES